MRKRFTVSWRKAAPCCRSKDGVVSQGNSSGGLFEDGPELGSGALAGAVGEVEDYDSCEMSVRKQAGDETSKGVPRRET